MNQYISTRRSQATSDALHELSKFVRWCGQDRKVGGLTPQEAASYGDLMSESAGRQDSAARVQAVKDFLSFCYKSNFTQTPLSKHLRVRRVGRRIAAREKVRDVMDITAEGYQSLVSELDSLRDERVTIAQDIRLAAADKDFKENAPLDAARERQGHLEARIRELEDGLQRANIVDTINQDSSSPTERKIKLGSKVRLLDPLSKEKMAYTLVNASEASPMDFKMSTSSPVGRALMDHTVGEEVEVATPRGNLRYLIEEVD